MHLKILVYQIQYHLNLKSNPEIISFFVNHQGYKTDTINLNIPLFYSANYVSVNSSLIPDKVFGERIPVNRQYTLLNSCSSELIDEAKSSWTYLESILINHLNLKVEIAGYTDNKEAGNIT